MVFTALIFAFMIQETPLMPGVENSVGYQSSGTSIEPRTTSESTPMIHGFLGRWTMMFHANAFLAGIQQSGSRGGDKLFSANWLMVSGTRQFGRQSLTLRSMLSFEPATITRRQYPLLFQTGETAYGLSIVNGQHPHDLIMELAGRYDVSVAERSQIFVYGGPTAEVALGPTAFPHRSSASENPLAPLGHHQQDSTHIATNVVTLGLAHGPIQLEASTFSGREADENRWNIGKGKPDSFAARLTVAPTSGFTGQFSTARINSPESVDLGVDTIRTTASIHHNLGFSSGHLSSSVIWGRNKNVKNGAGRIFNAYNLEVTTQFLRRNWAWTRIENVDRDRTLLPVQELLSCRLCGVLGFGLAQDHVVAGPRGRPIVVQDDPIGRVQAYTFGYEREIPIGLRWLNVGLGVQVTTYNLPTQLRAEYGKHPSTVAFFMRIRPVGNMADHMKQMHQRQ
jgi:hypothetical protein